MRIRNKKRLKTSILVILLLLMVNLTTINVKAVTEDEIEQAIDDGIAWLVSQQDPTTGKWQGAGAGGVSVALTGFVLIKLQDYAIERGKDPFETDSGEPDYYEYATNVIKGWEYLFTAGSFVGQYARKVTISLQPAGDPDFNGNGYGIVFRDPSGSYRDTYTTGICLMALEASGDPNRPNDGGLDYDGDLAADTLGKIAQDTADWLAYAQYDSGLYRGGWGYTTGVRSDNSITGYAVLGLAAAEGFGCTVPQWVKDELSIWIDYIQNDYNGGSGYASPNSWINLLKTGNLIFEMTFYGDDTTTTRFQNAMDYIENHWQDVNLEPGWKGDVFIDDDLDGLVDEDPYDGVDNDLDGLLDEDRGISHFQAMYCLMKGLEYSQIELIDHDNDGTADHDWYQEFADVLVDRQNDDGSWPNSPCYMSGTSWGTHSGKALSTVWALLTLEKVIPPRRTIEKSFSTTEGELGDVVHVTLTMNVPPGETITVVDTLPSGFHYEKGSFKLDGVSTTPKVKKNVISHTITEDGKHVIEFDVKVDEAKNWEDMIVCNVATATWYDLDEVEVDSQEVTECFVIHPFEELHKNVGIPKADVVFAIDLTGSMWDEIATVKTQATNIMNNLAAQIADVQFGLISFMDYVDYYSTTAPGSVPLTYSAWYGWAGAGDYPYNLDQDITPNTVTMATAITGLQLGSGSDGPQDYTRIIHESWNDPALTWRTGAERFLILFGDNVPHDTDFDNNNDVTLDNTGGDPGRDTFLGTADDLDFQTEVANAAVADVHIMAVYSGWTGQRFPWQYMASQTGGQYFELTEAEGIPAAIKNLIKSEAEETLTIKEKTETQWAIVIDVINPFSYTMADVVITDRFGAEIELDDADLLTPEIDESSITHGTWSYKTKGKSEKVFLTWEIGNLAPDETARLILLVSTDHNPAGKQEYSSSGIYELNSGATLKFIDSEQDVQLSAYTDSIYVTVLPEEDP